ncbi:bL21 family ribosomal protein [Candidatus Vidania fulgoroideae]|uniref:50S ribosomal protein L21 n=1 Tax=Candidatus Vidania fulgoroideorum TaxID=881286 RepID=A0A975ADT9_9PROT|nr:bL21 family ribosomal protein [Candidatus Vidania fulgoroideae]
MTVIFKYKSKQYLITQSKYVKVKDFGKEGIIVIKEIILLYSKGKLELGKPFINKNVIVQSELLNSEKKLSVKFRRRKRYLIRKGFKSKKYKIQLLGIVKNG